MLKLLCITTFLTLLTSIVIAGSIGGYHYEKPTVALSLVAGPANLGHGHSFGPIPTTQPLPPVPELPPLPTPRTKDQIVQTRTLYQSHPSTFFPTAGTGLGKIVQQYQPPGLQSSLAANSAPAFSSPSAPSTGLGSNLPNPAPVASQPLRVPFGKQAIISFPSGSPSHSSYEASGRQLKQYAVIEIIDNDIEQNTQPFLTSPFFDSFRAHIGASGTGAEPAPLGSTLLGTRSSNAFLGQQRSAAQTAANDAVALGSGGLGFIRLANGNVYLGSGSLGYVSGQQHSQEINEARTRSGAAQPDALHFGHGPLGNASRFNRFLYRFK